MSKHWPLVELGDIFSIARGGSPRPIRKFITDDPNGVNWIMISDATEGSKYITSTEKRIIPEGVKRSRMVNEGDFLLTNSMSFGKPYIVKTSGCIHDGWLVLSPKNANVDVDYFYHLLGSEFIYLEFSRRAAGATVKNLNIGLVKSVQVPLPPLAEQQQIAAILDKADALRAKRRAALAKLDTLLQATFLDMFGDPVTNPMGWEIQSLENICGKKGSYGSGASAVPHQTGMPRYIRITDINDDGSLNDDSVSPSTDKADWKKNQLVDGDVVFARSGATVGKTYLHRDENGYCVYAGYLIKFRPKPSVMRSEFLFSYTKTSPYEAWVKSRQKVVAQPNINAKQYGQELLIPVPPLKLQDDFVRRVNKIRGTRKRLERHLKQLDNLFHALQQRAFKGEL